MKIDPNFTKRLHEKLQACVENNCDLEELPADETYLEIHKLREMLTSVSIPFVFVRLYDGWQVCYPGDIRSDKCECSTVQHFFSRGSEDNLLEIMGLLSEEEKEEYGGVLGWLTAQEVFVRIKAHYERCNRRN